MHRSKRKQMARDTVRILKNGEYRCADGQMVSLQKSLATAVRGTTLYRPDDLPVELTESDSIAKHDIAIDVVNQTTIAGARDLFSEGAEKVAVLNFASAKNPGGGFLNGSEAQEEYLTRSSGLYDCLLAAKPYYENNRRCGTKLYTHHIIYSPNVPFFRDDEGGLCEFIEVSVITAPAPNLGAMNSPQEVKQCLPTFEDRANRVLEIARLNGEKNLVLGAWGCGVFRNDPVNVAAVFRSVLSQPGYLEFFDRIRFAVLDRGDKGAYRAFSECFLDISG